MALFSFPENLVWRFSLGATTEMGCRLHCLSQRFTKYAASFPHLPSLHLQVMDLQSWRLPPPCQWADTSRGGLEMLETLGSKIKPDPRSCPTPGDSPSHMGLRPAMCWDPDRGKASEISLFFLHPPATTLSFIFYSLMTWSFFRSNQSEYNTSYGCLW